MKIGDRVRILESAKSDSVFTAAGNIGTIVESSINREVTRDGITYRIWAVTDDEDIAGIGDWPWYIGEHNLELVENAS